MSRGPLGAVELGARRPAPRRRAYRFAPNIGVGWELLGRADSQGLSLVSAAAIRAVIQSSTSRSIHATLPLEMRTGAGNASSCIRRQAVERLSPTRSLTFRQDRKQAPVRAFSGDLPCDGDACSHADANGVLPGRRSAPRQVRKRFFLSVKCPSMLPLVQMRSMVCNCMHELMLGKGDMGAHIPRLSPGTSRLPLPKPGRLRPRSRHQRLDADDVHDARSDCKAFFLG